jgi:hypothetical protein
VTIRKVLTLMNRSSLCPPITAIAATDHRASIEPTLTASGACSPADGRSPIDRIHRTLGTAQKEVTKETATSDLAHSDQLKIIIGADDDVRPNCKQLLYTSPYVLP